MINITKPWYVKLYNKLKNNGKKDVDCGDIHGNYPLYNV
jgi:hypothetical protein